VQRNQGPVTLRRQLKCRDRIETKHFSSLGKDYRSESFRLTSSRPGHTRVHNGARTQGIKHPTRNMRPVTHPLVKALALQGVSGDSGSLACIRKDALAREVLAGTFWH
jgi:hypothetical protein